MHACDLLLANVGDYTHKMLFLPHFSFLSSACLGAVRVKRDEVGGGGKE
jgi:hypothetical protein